MLNKLKKLSDANYAVLLFFFLCIAQFIYIVIKYPFEINFGYEFGAVADAIRSGKGYANPWKFDSGATATVLPFLVYFHLLFFYLFGKTLTTFIFISVFKFASYGLSYYFILKCLRLNDIKVDHIIFTFIYLLFFSLSPTLNFEHTGDLWLYILTISWLLFGISSYFKGNRKTAIIYLSLFYFIAPQINPSIALAGIILLMILLLTNFFKVIDLSDIFRFKKYYKSQKIKEAIYPSLKYGIYFTFLFALSVSIWSIRNYFVFKTFIPTKSNLWMEYYLTNIKDRDGLLSYSTVLKYHPIGSDSIKELFIDYGEKEMMKRFETIGREHRKNNFDLYIKKTLNRIINAFVFTEYDLDVIPSTDFESFDPNDKIALNKGKYIVKGTWTCLYLSPADFNSIMLSLNIKKKQEVYNDWAAARSQYINKKNSFYIIFRSLLMGLIVTASMIFLLFTKYRSNLLIVSAIIFYVMYLLPYIMVSHQLRYHRPLFAVQLIVVYCVVLYFNQMLISIKNYQKDH